VVTDNVIDATGMNAINVRDAWGPVPGGGSATITDNTISNAAIGIHADVDRMKGGEPVPFVLVVDLVITGNTFTDNGTAIYYSPDAGSTANISGNTFAAGDVTNVYVEDATIPEDDVALDLDAILAGNTYNPRGRGDRQEDRADRPDPRAVDGAGGRARRRHREHVLDRRVHPGRRLRRATGRRSAPSSAWTGARSRPPTGSASTSSATTRATRA
jgi:hypothetical protein